MGMSVQSWLASLQALLPPGRAFTREPDANFTKLLEAVSAMFSSAESLAVDLRNQSADPQIATSMLPDWERLLGLPDDCTAGLDLSTPLRQRAASARLVELGGQSRAYFIALAEAYGEPGCTIDDGFAQMTCNDDCNDALYSLADVFTWRVNIPRPIDQVEAMTCNSDCNDALASFSLALAECPITERKPAHTQVIFSYAP